MPRTPLKKKGESSSATKRAKPIAGITLTKKREIIKTLSDLNDADLIEILSRIGVGGSASEPKYCTCYMCGSLKKVDEFYKSTDPKCMVGITRICKDCASAIAHGVDDTGVEHGLTKQNLQASLEYLDKPYLDNVFDSAIAKEQTYKDKGQNTDYWKCYMQIINSSTGRSSLMRWRDSDGMTGSYISMEQNIPKQAVVEESVDQKRETQERYEVNRRDTIRFIGYDPFADYPEEADKPRLYAQIVSFLDDEAKNDAFKLAAIIQIVKRLNQAEKLNAGIDRLMNDSAHYMENQALINKMMDTSKKNTDQALALAKDNGISINHNNNKSVGQQTLSGKIKKLKEIGLREAAINTFDEGSLSGMAQVARISEEARHQMIGYDESIAQEIKDIKVQLVEQLTRERDESRERARILMVENKDLKAFLKEKGLIDEHGRVIEGGVV